MEFDVLVTARAEADLQVLAVGQQINRRATLQINQYSFVTVRFSEGPVVNSEDSRCRLAGDSVTMSDAQKRIRADWNAQSGSQASSCLATAG